MTNRLATAAAAALAGMALIPGAARAAISDCAMLTNFASVTYMTTAGSGNEVSYAVTAWIKVTTPSIVVSKTASPTLQGAGGTVTFCINFQNLSYCASAVNVLVTDKTPDSMNFAPVGPNYYAWTNGPNNGTETDEFSTNGAAWTAGEPAAVGQYYLRWNFPRLAPRESGVICFRATVL